MENTINNQLNNLLDALKTVFVSKEDLISLLQNPTALKKTSIEKNIEKLIFTQKEINSMPKGFRKEFRTNGCTARVYKRQTGKSSYTYDIKYRRNGYNIIVTNTDLATAKKLFIEKLAVAEKVAIKRGSTPTTFNSFAMFYFEKFRKRKVTEATYRTDIRRYNKYLLPYFNEKPISKITAIECQELIDELSASGKGKTTDEIFCLMSIIFKGAIAHGILNKNPLDIVFHQKHTHTHGKALSKQEELTLLKATENTDYQLMFAIALYTGMRPNEYCTAKIDNGFIVCKNSKRKNGKFELKKIPITPMLKPYLTNATQLNFYPLDKLRKKFNSILSNHILYDLRTTFYSRCDECGVSDVAKKLFVGHSLGELGNAYTDLSDEYLLKEGDKIKY